MIKIRENVEESTSQGHLARSTTTDILNTLGLDNIGRVRGIPKR